MSGRDVEQSDGSTDGDAPLRRPLWPVLVASAIVVATVVVAGVITWQAFDGADDTTPELATARAAEGLSATLANDDLDDCPVGDGLLDQVAAALGDAALASMVLDGDVVVETTDGAMVRCVVAGGEDRLGITVSPSPADALDVLRGDPTLPPWEDLGRTNGGAYLGRCGVDDGCAVVWYDDRLLAMIDLAGPATAELGVEQVQAVLAAALPTVVGALAP